jgi:hypothetical protein
LLPRSNVLSAWTQAQVSTTTSTDFPIFSNEGVWLITANGTSGHKHTIRGITQHITPRTASVYLRRGSNNFAQISFTNDNTNFEPRNRCNR